jgi:Helix-turn-helix domain
MRKQPRRRLKEPKGRIIRLSNPPSEGGIVVQRVLLGRKMVFEIPKHGYVSIPEAAIILGCSEKRIYRLMDRGELRDFRKGKSQGNHARGGGRSYFRLSDIERLVGIRPVPWYTKSEKRGGNE